MEEHEGEGDCDGGGVEGEKGGIERWFLLRHRMMMGDVLSCMYVYPTHSDALIMYLIFFLLSHTFTVFFSDTKSAWHEERGVFLSWEGCVYIIEWIGGWRCAGMAGRRLNLHSREERW